MHARYSFHSVHRCCPVMVVVLIAYSSLVVRGTAAVRPEKTRHAVEPPELSERAATAINAIQVFSELSDWSGMAAAADALIAESRVDSYDHAVAHLYRAQANLSRGERDPAAYAAAIASLEHVVASGFWPPERVLDWTYQLAQLYAHAGRARDAAQVIQGWLAQSPAPTPQAYIILVGAFLEDLSAGADDLERALTRVDEGLRLGVRPDETLLYLKAACLQRLERWDEAAEMLEFILSRNPRQDARWEQLYAMYTTIGRDLPAVLTIERARAFGVLDSPRADIALGQHYHRLAQDHRALDALETGLRRGVDDPAPHWLFAAYLAFSAGDFSRTSRLLAAAEPVLDTDTQRHDHARLTEALAGVH